MIHIKPLIIKAKESISFFTITFLWFIFFKSVPSQAQDINDCLRKVEARWGDTCSLCSENELQYYIVICKNTCSYKIDALSMVLDACGEWKIFYKFGIAPGDTIQAYACNSKGSWKSEVRETGNKVPFSTYEEINAEYLALQKASQRNNQKKIDLYAKLLYGDSKKKPLINQKVMLKSNKGDSMQTVTNEYGDFSFEKVNVEDSLELLLDNNPGLAKTEKVYLAQQNGIIIQELKRNKANTFDYQLLPSDIYKMSSMEVEDPFLKIADFKQSSKNELIIVDNIYFDQNSWEILPDAAKTLDKVVAFLKDNPEISVELLSYTDSKGDDAANMKLSEKRAATSVKYIISKGIDTSRVSGQGRGETKILNRCVNGVDCSEKEHQLNRRIEFKFVKVPKK